MKAAPHINTLYIGNKKRLSLRPSDNLRNSLCVAVQLAIIVAQRQRKVNTENRAKRLYVGLVMDNNLTTKE
nr:MAG TPA: hypothetical protein [Caudoviricetes sp.]